MVTLNDADRAARLRRLRNHGVTHDPALMSEPDLLDGEGERLPWAYEQMELGWNYRMDEMSAALGLSQLAKLERFTARRADLAALYDAALEPLAPVVRTVPRGRAPRSFGGWQPRASRPRSTTSRSIASPG